MPTIRRPARETLTAVELDAGDVLLFDLTDGTAVTISLLGTGAQVIRTTLRELRAEEEGARTDYRFHCDLLINGARHRLEREVSTQRSFYEPWVIGGVRIWLDAVADILDFLTETHGDCRPGKQARFALQQADVPICPERVRPWCPLPRGGQCIEDCYRGEDCWLGA
jgi:hypothetical protein